MKKWIALILTAVMLLSLTACSDFISGLKSGMQDAALSTGDHLNKTITRGKVSGNTYTSAYSGLTFTKPANWRYLTEAELSETLNAGAEILDQDAFEQALASMISVYDMMVTDDSTGNNILVCYENLELTNSTSITPESYIASVEKQLASQAGFSLSAAGKQNVTLSGNSYYRAEYTIAYSGITMSQIYYIRKIDKYMNAVIVTIVDGTDLATIEAMFQR